MTALREWYSPPMRSAAPPSEERAHALGNLVMALREEITLVRDENTRLRTQQTTYLSWVTDLSDEVLRLTLLLLNERSARREASDDQQHA